MLFKLAAAQLRHQAPVVNLLNLGSLTAASLPLASNGIWIHAFWLSHLHNFGKSFRTKCISESHHMGFRPKHPDVSKIACETEGDIEAHSKQHSLTILIQTRECFQSVSGLLKLPVPSHEFDTVVQETQTLFELPGLTIPQGILGKQEGV